MWILNKNRIDLQKSKTIKKMKKLKRTAIIIAALAFLAPTIQSCKKVSPKKLDGEWEMTKGTIKTSSMDSDNVYDTYTYTYNGTTESVVRNYANVWSGYKDPDPKKFKMSITFDKKAGTYTQTITRESEKIEDFGTSYKLDNGTEVDQQDLDVKITSETKTVHTGVFTITGGTGDIKKNSQFVLRENDRNTDYKSTFQYFTKQGAPISAADRYKMNYGTNKHELLKTSEINTETIKGKNYIGVVYTVDELKGGVMEISASESEKRTVGNDTEDYSTNIKWTLSKK